MEQDKRNTAERGIERKIQFLFKEKGKKALEIARNLVLEETKKIECEEVREALQYFINEYWNDVVSPALICLGCEAVGGNPASTIPIAVPLILIGGAIDIHDDIIDKSKAKYNRPTVFGKYGQEIALLVGDALLLKGLTLLQDAVKYFSREEFTNIIKILNDAFFELGDAEALEIEFRDNLGVTPEEYLHVIRKKAADVEGLFHIGAIIGGGSSEKIETLCYYGRVFGLLSILRDDWIDTIDPKELLHRILFENLPLPLLYILQNQKAKVEAKQILQKSKKITEQDIERLLEIIEKFGGFKYIKRIMLDLANEANRKLLNSKLHTRNLRMLLRFVAHM